MTTLAPRTPTDSDHRRKGTIRHGLFALLAFAVLVAGPPAALASFIGNPVPDQAVVGGQLTDAAIVGMLAVIVWAAWAQLMVVVAVEAIGAVRGGALPRRIPFCGFQQHLARRLVVATSLLAGTSSVMATASGSAVAVAVQNPAASCADPAPAMPAPAVVREAGCATTVGLAGTEVVRSMPVGDQLVEDSQTIELEPDRGLWYAVKPPHGQHHDSLWDIAERHLGDGMRWREIYDLNKHRLQPDGHRLELARLIQPGWRLLMPADASGIPDGAERERPAEARIAEAPSPSPAVESPGAAVVPQARKASPATPMPTGTVAAALGANAPAAAAADRADPAPTAADGPVDEQGDDDTSVPFAMLSMGLGALACAGLTAELARRRRRMQRHRRPGERLRAQGTEAAAAERVLRAANAEITVLELRDALRALADTCHRQGRPLPDLHAVQLNATGATLLLGTDETHAVAPFLQAGPRSWTLQPDALPASAEGAATELDDDAVDPYPVLVALGVTDESILIINLEAAGTLRIAGDPAAAVPLLNALVAELGTSALASSAQLVLTGCAPGLAAILDTARVTLLDTDEAARGAQARRHDVATILVTAGVPDVAAARAARLAPDIWAPTVFIRVNDTLDGAGDTAAVDPHSGSCMVTTGGSASAEASGWTLRVADPGWTLDPLGVHVEPQRLDLSTLPCLVDLLDTTLAPAPPPLAASAPAPTTSNGDHPSSTAGAARADLARSGAITDPSPFAVAAAIPAPPEFGEGPSSVQGPETAEPRVLVLGPVEIVGVSSDGAPGRRRRATELVAYLALHPGATQFQLDEVLWPGARVPRNTRNPLVSRTRQWLGSGTDGQPYLGLVAEGGHYTLAPGVSCDWQDFCALAKRGLGAGSDGTGDLIAALELIRGRPFLGVNPAAYAWAEADTQDMISAIVDVAHTLSKLCLAAGDHRRARWGAARGLTAEPYAELLYQDAVRAAQVAGDEAEVERLVATLRRRIGEFDPEDDLTDVTLDLLKAPMLDV